MIPLMNCKDIWPQIVVWIDCGSDYKTICLVDHLRRNAIISVHPIADIKFANHLLTLITLMPDKWEGLWGNLATNVNMTEKFIKGHPRMRNVREDFALRNNGASWEFFQECVPGRFDLDLAYKAISARPCVTINIVKAHPHLNWNMKRLSANPGMTLDVILAHPEIAWDIDGLINNPNISFQKVVEMAGREFPFSLLGSHQVRNMTIRDILANPNLPWHWRSLSSHPAITFADILASPQLPWAADIVSMNPNVTPAIIEANPSYPWDTQGLSLNPSMTWEYVRSHPEKTWNWNYLVSHGVIPWVVIAPEGVLDPKFHASSVSNNPSLTWKIIHDNPEIGWDWKYIAQNTFGKIPA